MLSVQQSLSRATYCSRCCFQSRVNEHSLRVCSQIRHGSSSWVPEKLLVDEKDIDRFYIDPNVKKLAKDLKYCEYIERRSLRFGYKENSKLLNEMSFKAKKMQHDKLMNTQVMSSALKYLRPDLDKKDEESLKNKEFEERCKNLESESNPIYMPYAVTDSYEEIKMPEKIEETERFSDLNEDYQQLYEEYLKTNGTASAASFEEIVELVVSKDKKPEKPNKGVKKIPPDWMSAYEQHNDFSNTPPTNSFYGTPDPNYPVTTIPCGGCGAVLHCQDPAIPGYLPAELLKDQPEDILKSSVCQRCHFLRHYRTTLEVTVPVEQYPALLNHIKDQRVAIMMIIDLADFPCSIWSGIVDILAKKTPVFIVGNKVDLLPNDGPNFLNNVEKSLMDAVLAAGIDKKNIRAVNLISAKTGYGVERLINTLHKNWGYKGDVYMIGCTNVGKSSLFNALLRSDYCKVQAKDLIQRATVSHWPGTTLNLLKFPILNPVRWRLWLRMKRQMEQRELNQEEEKYRMEQFRVTDELRYSMLQGHIGRTFDNLYRTEGEGYIGQINPAFQDTSGRLGLDEKHNTYKYSRWCYDTPGTILPDQILHLLTTEELMETLPRHIITPRSFKLYRKQTLFIAGLGRLDLIKIPCNATCTVFASHKLPVTICKTERADELYKELLKTEAFAVPSNDPERLKLFPDLKSKDFEVAFEGKYTAEADVIFSSAGWISLQCPLKATARISAWTPMGKGIHLRTPALLPRSVQLKGYQVPGSQAFTKGKRVYTKR